MLWFWLPGPLWKSKCSFFFLIINCCQAHFWEAKINITCNTQITDYSTFQKILDQHKFHEAERHYRVHECGFRVCHQYKDISIQAKLVNPAVQFWCHICPRAKEANKVQDVKCTAFTKKIQLQFLIWTWLFSEHYLMCVHLYFRQCKTDVIQKMIWLTLLLPVNKHQVVSKKSTFGLRPKHTNKTTSVQTFIHVERMSQLVYSLQMGCKHMLWMQTYWLLFNVKAISVVYEIPIKKTLIISCLTLFAFCFYYVKRITDKYF